MDYSSAAPIDLRVAAKENSPYHKNPASILFFCHVQKGGGAVGLVRDTLRWWKPVPIKI
jgi:hypothetical protein